MTRSNKEAFRIILLLHEPIGYEIRSHVYIEILGGSMRLAGLDCKAGVRTRMAVEETLLVDRPRE
jgi:hypothetical protein